MSCCGRDLGMGASRRDGGRVGASHRAGSAGGEGTELRWGIRAGGSRALRREGLRAADRELAAPGSSLLGAGWGTFSAGTQPRATLAAEKAAASSKPEACKPPQGADEKPAGASCAAGRAGRGGHFQHVPTGTGWTVLCRNVKKNKGLGWGCSASPACQAPLGRCAAALPMVLAPRGLRTMLGCGTAQRVCPLGPS